MADMEIETEAPSSLTPIARMEPDEPAGARTQDGEAGIARLVDEFPQDASDEAFAQMLKKKYHCKKLRGACTQLGLHPQADPAMNHKDGYVLLLSQYRRARQRGEVFTGFPTKTKVKTKQKKRYSMEIDGRTKHCGFRLVNVVFSAVFYDRMVESGALPSSGLQVDPVDGRTKYWRDVSVAFASENPDFDRITGPPGRYEGIDPRLAVHHSPAKLCAIWKDMTIRYEESFARWKHVGTQDAGFAHFCGDLDVLYLHDRLQMQPIRVDHEQLRASKRVRTADVGRQDSESASVDAESDEEEERVERRNFLSPSEVEAPAQVRAPSVDSMQDPLFRRILPTPSVGPAPTQRRNFSGSSDVEMQTSSRPLEERIMEFLETERTEAQRRRANMYDGVKYSSQAVRDAVSAIEALKRGGFDRAVIAQAEESLDTIIQVWLRELDKAGRPTSNWTHSTPPDAEGRVVSPSLHEYVRSARSTHFEIHRPPVTPNSSTNSSQPSMNLQAPAKFVLFATALVSSINSSTAVAKWGYHRQNALENDDELSPDQWGQVYPSCNGTRQSPIDIDTAAVHHEARAEGCFTNSYDTVGLSFLGECKTFTLEALEDSFHWNAANDSTCAVQVASSGSTFKLAQFHLHMTSEHTVNGARHAGEIHFVHKETGGGKGVVVIAVFLDSGVSTGSKQEDDAVPLNPWISDVWSSLGKVNQTVQVAYPYAELLDQQIASGPVFNYPGSLTTPPCSEIVDWWALGAPVRMASDNLNSLRQQLQTREAAEDGDDARPTQALNGRTVLAY